MLPKQHRIHIANLWFIPINSREGYRACQGPLIVLDLLILRKGHSTVNAVSEFLVDTVTGDIKAQQVLLNRVPEQATEDSV